MIWGLIYENLEKMKKFEPKYRLKRVGAPWGTRMSPKKAGFFGEV